MVGRLAPLLALAMLLTAGCLSSEPLPAPGGASPLDAAAMLPDWTAWEYACPHPDARETAPGVCAAEARRQGASFQEPNLALHPASGAIWAVGANVGGVLPAGVPDAAARRTVALMRVEILFTEDGGRTFRTVELPIPEPYRPDGAIISVGDPSIAFDAEGVLHATAMQVMTRPGVLGLIQDVYYTSSPDLGLTWSPPVLLTETGRKDRNWLAAGPDGELLVAWQTRSAGTITVAASPDGGRTWPEDLRIDIEGCTMASPVVYRARQPHVACIDSPDGRPGAPLLWRLSPVDRIATRVATGDGNGIFPHLAFGPEGDVWMGLSRDSGGPVLLRSADGGATLESLDLADVLDVAGWSDLRALAVDRGGYAHVVVEAAPDPGCPRQACPNDSAFRHQVLHAVFSRAGDLLQRSILTPALAPPATGTPAFDDYHSVAFGDDAGLMAWSFEGALAVTRLLPREADEP